MMRVIGLRSDGAIAVLTAGKVVVLRGMWSSPPSEERDVEALGGWIEPKAYDADAIHTLHMLLGRSLVRPLRYFQLERDELGKFSASSKQDVGRLTGFGGSRSAKAGDRVRVMGRVKGQGKTMRVLSEAPSGGVMECEDDDGARCSYHVSDLQVDLDGTSEGAEKGWETRRSGGPTPMAQEERGDPKAWMRAGYSAKDAHKNASRHTRGEKYRKKGS